jgi:ureidoacrylate peracid hydrolase
MQGTFRAPGAPAEVPAARRLVAPANRLARALQARGAPVIRCPHASRGVGTGSDWRGVFDHFVAGAVRERTIESLAPGAPGQDVWTELEVAAEDIRISKDRYGALMTGASPLERILRSLGIEILLISGIKAKVCCEPTARDAMMLDFRVVMVADSCAALSEREHVATLETIIRQFGDVPTVDGVISRLGQDAVPPGARASGAPPPRRSPPAWRGSGAVKGGASAPFPISSSAPSALSGGSDLVSNATSSICRPSTPPWALISSTAILAPAIVSASIGANQALNGITRPKTGLSSAAAGVHDAAARAAAASADSPVALIT